ncbi:MAG TPA: TMEM175 family protein [Methanomicrobiales archaeon]|nr:TMEM175 family protein [Methanomicrobiales archaeon]
MTGDREAGGTGRISGLTKGRMENLTDGIFAFAMTLLVTTLDFPSTDASLPPLTPQMLVATYFPDFLNFFIAFVVLAGFWMAHHALFRHIRFIDRPLLWMNVLSLLFVALLPFSTDLAGDYPEVPLAAVVFEANLLAIGLFLSLIWNYATTDRRFVEKDLDEGIVRVHARRGLVIPGVSALGILLALLGLHWTTLIYIATPLFFLVTGREG